MCTLGSIPPSATFFSCTFLETNICYLHLFYFEYYSLILRSMEQSYTDDVQLFFFFEVSKKKKCSRGPNVASTFHFFFFYFSRAIRLVFI